MIKALDPKPVYEIEDYERDLAEIKLANSKPRPDVEYYKGPPFWLGVMLCFSLISSGFLIVMVFIFGLRWAGWL